MEKDKTEIYNLGICPICLKEVSKLEEVKHAFAAAVNG